MSLVPLDQLDPNEPYGLVSMVRNDLRSLDWSQFDEARERRLNTLAGPGQATYQGRGDFGGAQISGGYQAGTMLVAEHMTVLAGGYREEPEQVTKDRCVEAFLADLRRNADQRQVVLMLDAWDKANDRVGSWIVESLLDGHCLDVRSRPRSLLVVLAGRTLPLAYLEDRLVELMGAGGYQRIVSLRELGHLSSDADVARFLEVNGVPGVPAEIVAVARMLLTRGQSPQEVLLKVGEIMAMIR